MLNTIPVPTARQPVIILGMHRSGTSMISLLLDLLGMFVGKELQEDHESTYFLDLNEKLFERVHAVWDNPLPVAHLMQHPAAKQMTATALAADIASPGIGNFLGKKRLFSQQSLANFDRPWGWKDPRTVFTLPLWLELFPKAKLIYIVRNGVDVAASLRVREVRHLKRFQERFEQRMTARTHRSRLEYAGYKGSARCLSLEGGFALWQEYLAEADRNLNSVTNDRLIFRYEDFLQEPARHLEQLVKFCQLPQASEPRWTEAAARVSSDRARRFDSDPELSAFYEKVRGTPWMVRYQY